MNPVATQILVAFSAASLPTLTVLVSLLINNQRLSDMEKRTDQRFNDLRDMLRAEMYRMEQVLDARLKHLEGHR